MRILNFFTNLAIFINTQDIYEIDFWKENKIKIVAIFNLGFFWPFFRFKFKLFHLCLQNVKNTQTDSYDVINIYFY